MAKINNRLKKLSSDLKGGLVVFIGEDLQDLSTQVWKLIDASEELLDAYVEENGGDMPTNDGHPAHRVRLLLGQ